MTDHTKIEWADATWNPIGGCTRVSEECRNCYAEVMAARFSDPGQWGHGLARRVKLADGTTDHRWTGKVQLNEHRLDQPLRWKKPRRIFVNSTSDLFHESVPDEWIDRVFAVMALCPQHMFMVLTKRAGRMRWHMQKLTHDGPADRLADAAERAFGDDEAGVWVANYVNGWSRPNFVPDDNPADGTVLRWPLPNVWLGVSAGTQEAADDRIPELLATPAAVRFVSAEPLLGPVDLTGIRVEPTWYINALWSDDDPADDLEFRGATIDWVIVGGESGPAARPMHPQWARDIRDQCRAAGVAYFFKQWGEWGPCDHLGDAVDGWAFGCFDDAGQWVHPVDQDWASRGRTILFRAGKRDAGRLLDGREWNEVPG